MNLAVDMAYFAAGWLIFVRLSALFILTPLFAVGQLPIKIKTLWLLPMALAIAALPSVTPLSVPISVTFLIQSVLYECIVGALLGFGIFAAFAVFAFGGRILDFQMGFGVANLIDPSTNGQAPLIGTLLTLLAVTVFFLVVRHHWLLRGVVYSFDAIPLGAGIRSVAVFPMLTQFGLMFTYGLMLVAPVVFALLLVDVGMAVIARTMPQVNMFIVSLPIKIFIGLTLLAASLNYMGPLFQNVFRSVFTYWEAVLE